LIDGIEKTLEETARIMAELMNREKAYSGEWIRQKQEQSLEIIRQKLKEEQLD